MQEPTERFSLKTVGTLAVIVVLVAALIVAATADDDEPEPLKGGLAAFEEPIDSRARPPQLPSPSPAPSPAATPSPSPLFSPTPVPSPLPTTSPSPLGEQLLVLVGGIEVPLPAPWQLQSTNGYEALLVDGRGNAAYFAAIPGAYGLDASLMCFPMFDGLITKSGFYTDVETSGCAPLQPFGTITTFAAITYRATAVDQQGAVRVQGQMWIAVRQDGTELLAFAETRPPESFEPNKPQWNPVIEGTFNSYSSL